MRLLVLLREDKTILIIFQGKWFDVESDDSLVTFSCLVGLYCNIEMIVDYV